MKNHTYAKQLARFPYCRIYRHFFNRFTENCQIRKQGEGLLYRYMSLFSLVNFRPALRTVHGQRYVIQAGEWVASYSELKERLHLPTYKMLRDALKRLAAINLIEYNDDSLRKIVRLKITCWSKTNTTRTYSAPCPKDTGFFFFPKKQLATLIGSDRCSEADILLDLWLNTVFRDPQVPGSDLCPVVHLSGENCLPLVSYSRLADRWNVSKATVHRVLKKFETLGLLTCYHCAGKRGSVLMIRGYLATMFCINESSPTAQELSTRMHPSYRKAEPVSGCTSDIVPPPSEPSPILPEIVSKPDIPLILENLRNALFSSGFRCSACPNAIYRLSNLSACKEGLLPYDLAIYCSTSGKIYRFSLKLEMSDIYPDVDVEVI